jgi:hypothetical protein
MVSSNNGLDAEEMFKSVRHFSKDFLEYLYIAAEKDGNFVLPEEAVAAFFRFLRDQPGQPGLSIDLTDSEEDRLGRRLYRHLCDDAAAAYIRHSSGLKIIKGKPGRPPDSKAQEYLEQHSGDSSYADIAKQELQSVPDGEAKTLLVEKESERIRASVRRTRRRQSKQLPRT